MPNVAKSAVYAVARGRVPGVYPEWKLCETQILNFRGGKYKKFYDATEAEAWVNQNAAWDAPSPTPTFSTPAPIRNIQCVAVRTSTLPETSRVPEGYHAAATCTAQRLVAGPSELVLYTDGSCRGNGQQDPVAGVGVWWGHDDPRNISERCPGRQTNNRAELIALIRALETAPTDDRPLVLKTDSQYSISCLQEWFSGWERRGFRNAKGNVVENVSLIKLAKCLIDTRQQGGQRVKLVYVKGHSGLEGNDGADRLANLGATYPARPDRDWEELMQQARAVMSLAVVPPSACSAASDHPRTAGLTARKPFDCLESSKPGETIRAEITQSCTRLKESTRSASEMRGVDDAHASISSAEWQGYADAWLDDDEFIREARQMGV